MKMEMMVVTGLAAITIIAAFVGKCKRKRTAATSGGSRGSQLSLLTFREPESV